MLKYYLSQIDTISKKISLFLSKTDCIFLYGELGSGKTTFVRSLVHQLQKKNRIKKTEVVSPTFSLLHEYEIKNLKVMHYDLYRLKKSSDINNIGLYDLEDKMISIIEWPELIKNKHKNRIEIKLSYTKKDNERNVSIKYFGSIKR